MTGHPESESSVSDLLGRERAIRIVRAVLDRDRELDNDGRAVSIILALDHPDDEDYRS